MQYPTDFVPASPLHTARGSLTVRCPDRSRGASHRRVVTRPGCRRGGGAREHTGTVSTETGSRVTDGCSVVFVWFSLGIVWGDYSRPGYPLISQRSGWPVAGTCCMMWEGSSHNPAFWRFNAMFCQSNQNWKFFGNKNVYIVCHITILAMRLLWEWMLGF